MKQELWIHIVTNGEEVEYHLLGESHLEKKIISYIDQDGLTSMILDIENQKLIRENNDIFIECSFLPNEKTYQKINLKEYNQSLEIPMETKTFLVSDYFIKIEYIVDKKDTIIYEIKM